MAVSSYNVQNLRGQSLLFRCSFNSAIAHALLEEPGSMPTSGRKARSSIRPMPLFGWTIRPDRYRRTRREH